MFIYFSEYFNIFSYLFIGIFLSIIIIILARSLAPRHLNFEKLSAYECGFEPFSSTRIKFDISFALIAILFLVFDLEIIYLIPWALNIMQLGILGFIIMYLFLGILIFGFIFEILRKILDWEKDFV